MDEEDIFVGPCKNPPFQLVFPHVLVFSSLLAVSQRSGAAIGQGFSKDFP